MKIIGYIKSAIETIRIGNLVMMCLSLLLVRYTIIVPILILGDIPSAISADAFTYLVLSILFIASGGYIINDYFDVGIDLINKPGKNKIGIPFPRKNALALYILLTLTGLIFAWYFGELVGIKYPLLVMIITTGLLYFYSSTYKKMLLIGNLIIAILTGTTLFLPVLFDSTARHETPIVILIGGYSIFAFILTLIREIIKDCEDVNGDEAFNASTLPIIIGQKNTRYVAAFLTLLTLGTIIHIQDKQEQWDDRISFVYVLIFIQLPLLYLAIRILLAKTTENYHFASKLSKMVMVAGVVSMLVFYIVTLLPTIFA
jgi:4-hydroxybenzoate polyprenyltransferase